MNIWIVINLSINLAALINLLKFVLSNETYLVKKHDIFQLSNKVSLLLL